MDPRSFPRQFPLHNKFQASQLPKSRSSRQLSPLKRSRPSRLPRRLVRQSTQCGGGSFSAGGSRPSYLSCPPRLSRVSCLFFHVHSHIIPFLSPRESTDRCPKTRCPESHLGLFHEPMRIWSCRMNIAKRQEPTLDDPPFAVPNQKH